MTVTRHALTWRSRGQIGQGHTVTITVTVTVAWLLWPLGCCQRGTACRMTAKVSSSVGFKNFCWGSKVGSGDGSEVPEWGPWQTPSRQPWDEVLQKLKHFDIRYMKHYSHPTLTSHPSVHPTLQTISVHIQLLLLLGLFGINYTNLPYLISAISNAQHTTQVC